MFIYVNVHAGTWLHKNQNMKVFFFISGLSTTHLAGSQCPNQRSNLCPLQWKRGVLTTGPPGNSPKYSYKLIRTV